jgi:hypothetical protein
VLCGKVFAISHTVNLLATVTVKGRTVSLSGILLIGGQLALSYFIARFSKLLSPIWRKGMAVVGVMATHTYGHSLAARAYRRSAIVGFTVCWLVIVADGLFPLALFAPLHVLVLALFT